MAKKRGKKQESPVEAALRIGGVIVVQTTAPETSAAVLEELGTLNDYALEAKGTWEAAKEEAKEAKEAYDTAVERVLTRLREATHRSDLPLFDREADQARMEAGPEGLTEAAGGAPGADLGAEPPEMAPEDEAALQAF